MGKIAGEDEAQGRSYVESLRKREFGPIEEAAGDSIESEEDLAGTLTEMADVFPSGEPESVTLVGAHRFTSDGTSRLDLTYEYEFPDQWVLASVVLEESNGESKIVGLNVNPQKESLKEQNRFTLSGKTPAHYLILLLAIVLPLFTLWTLILCIRTNIKGKKWPWILFVLFGFGQLGLNWTTGDLSFNPVSFQLFSSSIFSAFNGPWTLSISIPVGAIVFLVKRNELKADETPADPYVYVPPTVPRP